MKPVLLPPIWLIVLIVGLPLLSETVYTPSLPEIASSMQASVSTVEYTLTTYLLGFTLGTLFWGNLSDRLGRKYCVLTGFSIFIIGCIGCFSSDSIALLMLSRFIQAFGGSTGSILGQAICRDAFQGPALGKVYSIVGGALAIFPAFGPIMGGLIAEYMGWSFIFLFLIIVVFIVCLLIAWKLPETHHSDHRIQNSLWTILLGIIQDKKIIGLGIIVAGCNGISFSYYAEGSFYLIKMLGLSPSQYGTSFIALAVSTLLGGLISRKLHDTRESKVIMGYGLITIFISSVLFTCLAYGYSHFTALPEWLMIGITVMAQMSIMLGICMTTSNALAIALTDYKWCIGTASSIFGFFYYALISLFTFGMGYLHNGTLVIMPLYFLCISILMLIINKKIDRIL